MTEIKERPPVLAHREVFLTDRGTSDLSFLTPFDGFYKPIIFHNLLKLRGRIFFIRVQCGVIQSFTALPLDDQSVKSICLEKFFYFSALLPSVDKAYFYLEILLCTEYAAVEMEQTLYCNNNDGCSQSDYI